MTDSILQNGFLKRLLAGFAVLAVSLFIFAVAPCAQAATPAISSATIKTSGTSTIIKVIFNYPVFNAADGTGNLATTDFTFTDATTPALGISWVSHTAGNDYAMVGIDGPVTTVDTVDTIGAANNSSIFTIGGQLKQTQKAIEPDATAPTMDAVEFTAGTTRAMVTFSEGVYGAIPSNGTNAGTGLEAADFAFTNGNGAGATALASVTHTPGSKYAYLTLTGTTVAGDVADSLAIVADSIYDANGTAAVAAARDFDLDTAVPPVISSLKYKTGQTKILLIFSEPVTDETGAALTTTTDFAYVDASSGDAGSISSISHVAYNNFAILTMNANLADGDKADTIALDAAKLIDVGGNIPIAGAGGTTATALSQLDGTADAVFDADATAPTISSIKYKTGQTKILLIFSEAVYNQAGGALDADNFRYVDASADGAASISAVSHVAGDNYAILTMNTNLLATDHADTIAVSSYGFPQDVAGNVAAAEAGGTTATTLDDLDGSDNDTLGQDTAIPTITSIKYKIGQTKILVVFSERVTDETATPAALTTTDFVYRDVSGANAASISAVSHVVNQDWAILEMDVALADGDKADTLAFAGDNVEDLYGNVGKVGVTLGQLDSIPDQNLNGDSAIPTITSIKYKTEQTKILVVFSERVTDESGTPAALAITDFVYRDVSGAGAATISAINHNLNEDWAILTMNVNLADGDKADTLAFAGNNVEDIHGNVGKVGVTLGQLDSVGDASLDADATAPKINQLFMKAGQNKILVVFNEGVYDETGAAIDAGDFTYVDVSTDNVASISSVSHVAGNDWAILTMNASLHANDAVDTIKLDDATNYLTDIVGNSATAEAGGTTATAISQLDGVADANFDADATGPLISTIQAKIGSDTVVVNFTEHVYDETAAALTTADFTYANVAGAGATDISAVSHVAGDDFAILTLDAVLVAADQADTIALNANIKDVVGNAAQAVAKGTTATTLDVLDGTTDAAITEDTTTPVISSIKYKTTSTKILVTFSEPVTDETASPAALAIADFVYTDASGGDAGSISAVSHVKGDDFAILTMNAAIAAGDVADTIAFATAKVEDGVGNVGTQGAPLRQIDGTDDASFSADSTAPKISSIQAKVGSAVVLVKFNEQAYDQGGNALGTSDFTYADASGDGAGSISTVSHVAGNDFAVLTLNAVIASTDQADTIALPTAIDNIIDVVGNTATAEAGGSTATTLDDLDGTTDTAITQDTTIPVISSITYKATSTKVLVNFNEQVTDETATPDALAAADFTYTDASGGDAGSISAVAHVVYNDFAVLTMNAAIADGDKVDTIAFTTAKVEDVVANVGIQGAPLRQIDGTNDASFSADSTAPKISQLYPKVGTTKMLVVFNEQVYDEGAAALSAVDFDYTDGDEAGAGSISSVAHVAGDDWAILTLNANFAAADKDDQISLNVVGDTTYVIDIVGNQPAAEAGGNTDTDIDALDGVADDNLDQDTTAPKINTITTKNSQTIVLLTFNQQVTDDTSAGLALTDFIYVDASGDGAGSIASIVHTTGEDFAILTMNAAVAATDKDDTIRLNNSYLIDIVGNTAGAETGGTTATTLDDLDGTDNATLDADATKPYITSIQYKTGQTKVLLNMSEPVYDEGAVAVDTTDFTYADVSTANAGSISAVSHVAGNNFIVLTMNANLAAGDNVDTVLLKVAANYLKDIVGNTAETTGYGGSIATQLNDLGAPDNAADPIAITTVQATKGSTLMLVTFDEPAFSVNDGSGAVANTDFDYTDTTEDTAVITGTAAIHTAGNTWLILTRSVAIAAGDMNSDTLDDYKTAASIFDYVGNAAATGSAVAIDDTVAPIIVSATTLDSNANGLIDHYKLTFSEPVDTDQVTGWADGTIGGTMGAEIAIAAKYDTSNMLLDDTATIMTGETNTDDNAILYVKFAQESDNTTDIAQGDTDATPDITTATLSAQDFGATPNLVENLAAGDLTEADGAIPVILPSSNGTNPPKGIIGAAVLNISFSEPVYATANQTGNLVKADFAYTDVGTDSATDFHATTEASHAAGQRKVTLTMDANFASPGDLAETINAVATSVYDAVGNAAPATAITFLLVNGDKTITLPAGWSVVSTPNVLSDVSFANGGTGITFYTLTAGTWASATANTTNVIPLTGFMVNNTTGGTVDMYLTYASGISTSAKLRSKSLAAGWHVVGVALNESAGYANAEDVLSSLSVGNDAKYSNVIDFTTDAFANGALTTSYAVADTWTLQSQTAIDTTATIDMKEFMSYGVFVNSDSTYAGVASN